MLKKIFRPKGWLIGAGLIHFVMGVIVQLAMADMVAQMAWGEGNVGPRDLFYETYVGLMIFPHAVILLAAAFMFKGAAQARVAALMGGSTMLGFVGVGVIASNAGYMAEMGVVGALAPPIILFAGLTLAGALGWNDEPGQG